jgi:hypothetical protein
MPDDVNGACEVVQERGTTYTALARTPIVNKRYYYNGSDNGRLISRIIIQEGSLQYK